MTHQLSWIHCSELRISFNYRCFAHRFCDLDKSLPSIRYHVNLVVLPGKASFLRPTFGTFVPTPDFRRIDLALGERRQ